MAGRRHAVRNLKQKKDVARGGEEDLYNCLNDSVIGEDFYQCILNDPDFQDTYDALESSDPEIYCPGFEDYTEIYADCISDVCEGDISCEDFAASFAPDEYEINDGPFQCDEFASDFIIQVCEGSKLGSTRVTASPTGTPTFLTASPTGEPELFTESPTADPTGSPTASPVFVTFEPTASPEVSAANVASTAALAAMIIGFFLNNHH